YVDQSTGAERCKGSGTADPKRVAYDGETVTVTITFDPPCKRAKPGVTIASYTFEPSKGAAISKANESFHVGLETWDQQNATNDRFAEEEAAIAPSLDAEKKRLAEVVDVVSSLDVKPPVVKCAGPLSDSVARVTYDDLLANAGRKIEHPEVNALAWLDDG